MDFKYGLFIQRVHPDKSPLKIMEKREHRRIQGLPKFFGAIIHKPYRVDIFAIAQLSCFLYRQWEIS